MKRIITTLFLLFVCACVWAQAPQKMSYQAVVRNANNTLVTNQNVSARISILQGSATGSAVYTETQTSTTNANGLMTVTIGDGTVVSGAFGTIDWANGPYFLKSEIDPNGGTSYTVESVQQLMSVPYALYAATSGNGEGPQGPVGPQGPQGDTGATGPQGPAGQDGVSPTVATTTTPTGTFVVITDASGSHQFFVANGADGAPGSQGPQGIQGATGPQGPAGADGTNGTNGADGRGILSIIGPVSNGLIDTYTITYTDGTTSTFTVTNGAAGVQGPAGPQGVQGATGATGPQGPSGANGADGRGILNIIGPVSNGLIDTYTITYTDGTTSTFTVTNGAAGVQGLQGPVGPAGANGTNGQDGFSPVVTTTAAGDSTVVTITDANGPHTFVLHNGQQGPQGLQGPVGPAGAQGPQGEQGLQGATGPQGPVGPTGANGTDGRGIANVAGPVSAGNVDTYTINYTDGTTSTFTVTNGLDGAAAAAGIGIDSIAKTGTNGLVDTYTINYTDGTTSTYTVTNGAAGAQGPQGPQGVQGETGATGATGPQGPAGADGTNGADGRGIQSISGPVTNGLADTYTINYTDGTTSTFTVTNGAAGAQGPEGPQGPAGSNGTNGISPTVTAAAAGSNVIITVTDGTGTHTYTIPTSSGEITQQPADWNATSGVTQILNKPNLATVATTGDYNDLSNKPTLFSGNYNDLTNKPTLFSGNYNDLTNKPTIPTVNNATLTIQKNGSFVGTFTANASANKTINISVPTTTSELTNNSGFLTSYTETDPTIYSWAKASTKPTYSYSEILNTPTLFDGNYNSLMNRPNLAAVATTGNYNDLTNKPTLFSGNYNDLTNKPTIPTVNNATLTIQKNGSSVGTFTANASSNKTINISVPTTTSELTNNSGFLTSYTETDPTIYSWAKASTKPTYSYSEILNTPTLFDGNYNSLTNRPNLATVATTGNYNDLTNKPTLFSGNYNDLTNKPTIPTVNNATLTIQKNGSSIGTFTANASANKTVNVTVPTAMSELNNDVGYLTANACGDMDICAMASLINQLQAQVAALQTPLLPTVVDGSACPGTPTVTDYDGNTYNTVKIGNQCWMKENMRATHYSDGTAIAQGTAGSVTTPYWYYPNNAASNKTVYGLLYNWPAVMHTANSSNTSQSNVQGICPIGWHVPSKAEWGQLRNYLGAQSSYVCNNNANNVAKALSSTTGWATSSNTCAVGNSQGNNNLSGFNAMPSGEYNGSYAGFGQTAKIWTATDSNSTIAWRVGLAYNQSNLVDYHPDKGCGFPVRCVRNETGSTASNPDQPASSVALPVVTTSTVSGVTTTSAVCGGTVTATGGSAVTARGVCWGISQYPTVSGSHTTNGSGTGAFTSNLTGLTAGATYYVRAYATNASGTAYGTQYSFVAAEVPVVTTGNISKLYVSTVDMAGNITSDGGYAVTSRGFCFSTSPNPTVSSTLKVTAGSGNGSFSATMRGLAAGTTYYVRAFATNSQGTAYGVQKTITTQAHGAPCTNGPATVTDIDGNTYHTLQMGTQCWMKENMRTTKLPDGTNIALQTSSTVSTTVKYRYYPNNNANNVALYGYLYNYSSAMNGTNFHNESDTTKVQGICPTGWHIPSKNEWQIVVAYMKSQDIYFCGGNSVKITKAMSSSSGWESNTTNCTPGCDQASNNLSQFGAYPAGALKNYSFGFYAKFWSSTYGQMSCNPYDIPVHFTIYGDQTQYNIGVANRCSSLTGLEYAAPVEKDNALSVRCLKN